MSEHFNVEFFWGKMNEVEFISKVFFTSVFVSDFFCVAYVESCKNDFG